MPQDQPFDVRRAGVLLHVTSLPGSGRLGPAAYEFVDFLAEAGCTVWQVLPLVPVHDGDGSPYNSLSSMAGNPDLIDETMSHQYGMTADAELSDGLPLVPPTRRRLEAMVAGINNRSESRGMMPPMFGDLTPDSHVPDRGHY